MRLFDETHGAGIALEEGLEESVRLAAKDVLENLRRLAPGRRFDFEKSGAIRVRKSGGEAESWRVRVEETKITIEGADELGCIYGLYAFSRLLGVTPFYRFTDLFPAARERMDLEETEIISEKKHTRFRGWFLNDEDLLCDFLGGGGKREIDYPYYNNVIHPRVLDRVLETALRMEMNLIIPASFVNVLNPAEEAMVAAATRRGLYVSQHHVEPMGVSFFSARRYLDEKGLQEEPVSYAANPRRMEEIWRLYAEKWAKYGDKVIWQLGLRGKADVPVWKTDSAVPANSAARGKLITEAIAAQYAILQELLKKPFLSTVTLWLECASLYGKGHLKIPADCITVYSDIGLTQLFGEDFHQARPDPARKAGVYYHVAFFGCGPHLAEGCDPGKAAYCYKLASEKDFLFYSLLNVSNLRPLQFGARVNAEILKDPARADANAISEKLIFEDVGADASALIPLVRRYYDCIAELGKRDAKEYCKHVYTFFFHDHGEGFPYKELPATDGFLRMAGKRVLSGKFISADPEAFERILAESREKWARLSEELDRFAADHPASRAYTEKFWGFEAFYLLRLTDWVIALLRRRKAKDGEKAAYTETACRALEEILERRAVLEQGEWAGWHKGDKKINLPAMLRLTESGEEAPNG